MREYESGTVGNAGFRDPQSHAHPEESINWPVKGVIAAVYPSDHLNNGNGQMLCDVSLCDYDYTVFKVPVLSPSFHQDTNADNNTLARQRAKPRARNIFDGEFWTPSVGTICIMVFVGPPGPQRSAYIIGYAPVANQSLPHPNREKADKIYPREAQAVTVIKDGQPTEEFRSRLHPTDAETPRRTMIQNGTAREIDNRGNYNVQTTINKEPIERERYNNYNYKDPDITKTPDPEGNVVFSSRGAKKGNIAFVTGRLKVKPNKEIGEEIEETNEEGNHLRHSSFAEQGNITDDLRDAKQGSYSLFTGKGNAKDSQQAEGAITFKAHRAKDGSLTIMLDDCDVGDFLLATSKSKKGKMTLSTANAKDGKITIVDRKGSSVVWNTKSGDINVSAKNKLTASAKKDATISAGGKLIANAKKDVTVNASGKVNINAKGDVAVNSSGKLDIKAKTDITLTTPTFIWLIATQIKHKKYIPLVGGGGGLATTLESLGISTETITAVTTALDSLGVSTDILTSIEGGLDSLASLGFSDLTSITDMLGSLDLAGLADRSEERR